MRPLRTNGEAGLLEYRIPQTRYDTPEINLQLQQEIAQKKLCAHWKLKDRQHRNTSERRLFFTLQTSFQRSLSILKTIFQNFNTSHMFKLSRGNWLVITNWEKLSRRPLDNWVVRDFSLGTRYLNTHYHIWKTYMLLYSLWASFGNLIASSCPNSPESKNPSANPKKPNVWKCSLLFTYLLGLPPWSLYCS